MNIYIPEDTISEEHAIYASTQVDGHPYYLYCLVTSKYSQKKFNSLDEIDKIIEYEIQQGKIYGFWQTHFEENREIINNDNDKEIGKKIIYYFTRYSDKEVDIAEIARDIGISKDEVENKIKKLYEGDLVYKTKARFYAFRDICLMRYIKYAYEIDLENVKPIDLSEKGRFNILKGHFLELVVQQVMSKFNGEVLEGKYFGQNGTIVAPRFMIADTRYAKGEKTELFQIDVFGRLQGSEKVWLCECKYRKTKMNLEEIKKLELARDAYLEQAKGEEQILLETHLWYISTGGFTEEALEYLKNKKDTYFSDYENINDIFKLYGGGFRIPIFIKE
jgi:DNA-binding transcriptional ArsR family regulator